MQMNVDGQRVKTLRLRQSWTQELLAEKAGVSLRTIQRIEGGGVASLQSLRAVAAALGVPAASLAVLPADTADTADTGSSLAQADAAENGSERADDAQDGREPAEPAAAPPPTAAPAPRPSPVGRLRATVPLRDLLRTALPAVAVTLLLGVVFVAFHFAGDRDLARQRGAGDVAEPAPRIVTVGYGNVELAVAASGKLEPSRHVRVEGVPGARVERILVAVGEEVEQDQLVAYLDARALQNRVESAEAGTAILRSQVTTRRSALQLATSRLEEAQRRFAADGGDELAREVEEARHGLVKAQADLFEAQQQARAGELELSAVRAELERLFVKAPLSGTVVSISSAPGTVLDRDAPVVLEIADLETMTAVVAIPESDVNDLREGGEAYATTLYGQRRQGVLRKILPAPAAGDAMLSYRGIVELDNADRRLKPAMTAQVFFPLESAENVLVVPVTALTMTAGDGGPRRATVRVVSPDGGTEDREIVLGAVDRINAEVISGLRGGERVLAGGQSS